jgi:hypothetical protein
MRSWVLLLCLLWPLRQAVTTSSPAGGLLLPPDLISVNLTAARARTKKVIAIVVGTRPEVIKMAPVIREFKRRTDEFFTIVVGTGQHKQMFNQILNLIRINILLKFR